MSIFRKLALPLMVAVLSLAPASGVALAQADSFDAEVQPPALNVRSGPGLGYSVLTVIPQFDEVEVVGRDSACVWAEVITEGDVRGWVGNALVTPTTSSGDFCALPINATYYPQGYIGTAAANVRSGPSTDFAATDVVYFGTNINMIGRDATSSWVYLQYTDEDNTDEQGWVARSAIATGTLVGTLPIVEADDPGTDDPGDDTGDDDNGGDNGDTTDPVTDEATITAGALNFRTGPGLGFGILDVLYQGDVVTMTGRTADGDWTRVEQADGTVGWVSTFYLDYNAAAYATLPILDVDETATGVINTGALNVREGPSTAYDIITAIPQGTVVTLLGRNLNSSWVYIRLADGTEGWSSSFYIDSSVPFSTLPVK